ncbi:hypothetical protein ASD31_01070 [Rhizobium sp. Root482]|nr:hypothetical protein ASD31_01070 [Rhizobium sp. Root482]
MPASDKDAGFFVGAAKRCHGFFRGQRAGYARAALTGADLQGEYRRWKPDAPQEASAEAREAE